MAIKSFSRTRCTVSVWISASGCVGNLGEIMQKWQTQQCHILSGGTASFQQICHHKDILRTVKWKINDFFSWHLQYSHLLLCYKSIIHYFSLCCILLCAFPPMITFDWPFLRQPLVITAIWRSPHACTPLLHNSSRRKVFGERSQFGYLQHCSICFNALIIHSGKPTARMMTPFYWPFPLVMMLPVFCCRPTISKDNMSNRSWHRGHLACSNARIKCDGRMQGWVCWIKMYHHKHTVKSASLKPCVKLWDDAASPGGWHGGNGQEG